jgi:hypothetical protein
VIGIGTPQPADEEAVWEGKTRCCLKRKNHALPNAQARSGRLQQRDEPGWGVYEADYPLSQVVWSEGFWLSSEGIVAGDGHEYRAWVGPAVSETGAVTGLEDMQADKGAWSIWDKPVSQRCCLAGSEENHA